MTASPNRNRIDQRTPTTSFVGLPARVEADLRVQPRVASPSQSAFRRSSDRPKQDCRPAPGESAQLTPLAGARPIAKISIGLRLAASA